MSQNDSRGQKVKGYVIWHTPKGQKVTLIDYRLKNNIALTD